MNTFAVGGSVGEECVYRQLNNYFMVVSAHLIPHLDVVLSNVLMGKSISHKRCKVHMSPLDRMLWTVHHFVRKLIVGPLECPNSSRTYPQLKF